MQTTAILVGALMLVQACSGVTEPAVFSVQCHCSIVQLIADPERYSGKRVRVIGVLIPVEHSTGVGQLYLSEDDARYINDANSIFVDTRNGSNSEVPPLSSVTGKFVAVEGVFTVQGEQLTIESVHNVRVLPPLALNNSRFE